MSVRIDSTTDRVYGAGPAIGTASYSWGFCWRPNDTSGVQVAALSDDLDTPSATFISFEISGGTISLWGANGQTDTFAFSADTDYYVVLSRGAIGSNRTVARMFTAAGTSTPVWTSNNSSQNGAENLTRAFRCFGQAYGNNAADAQIEAEKWELGVEWSNAECWAEAQKYTLQRAGGTPALECYLTNIDADDQGLNDSVGTLDLTNSGAVNGTDHPSFLETLSSGTTLYFLDSAASGSNFGQLQVGGSAPSTATTATGWTVDTVGATNYALMAYASERASSVFSGTAQPAGNPDNSLGDCFRSTSTMSGDFATGVWTIAIPVIAVSAAAGQDGRVRVRLWKSANATGTSPTEITSGAVAGTTVTNLATGAEQVSTVTTGSITGFSMANEYLFVQVAWEITGAAT